MKKGLWIFFVILILCSPVFGNDSSSTISVNENAFNAAIESVNKTNNHVNNILTYGLGLAALIIAGIQILYIREKINVRSEIKNYEDKLDTQKTQVEEKIESFFYDRKEENMFSLFDRLAGCDLQKSIERTQ